MTFLYLAAFTAGLLIAVGVMLFGIEHETTGGQHAPGSEPMALRGSLPLVSAFAAAFGLAGYLTGRATSPTVALAAAVAAGAVAALLSRWMVRKSEAMVPEFDVDDEKYVLQGHIAHVVEHIAAGAESEGTIEFDVGSTRRSFRARSIDGTAVEPGTEVVIERIDGDVAYVEPWAQVERRL